MSSSHNAHTSSTHGGAPQPGASMHASQQGAQQSATSNRGVHNTTWRKVGYWLAGLLVIILLLVWRSDNKDDIADKNTAANTPPITNSAPAANAVAPMQTPMTRVVLSKEPSTPVVVENGICIFSYMEGTGEDPEKTEVVLTGKKKDDWIVYEEYLDLAKELQAKPKINLIRWSGEGVLLYRFQKCSFSS